MIAINTYTLGTLAAAPSANGAADHSSVRTGKEKPDPVKPSAERKSKFRVNRFEDL